MRNGTLKLAKIAALAAMLTSTSSYAACTGVWDVLDSLADEFGEDVVDVVSNMGCARSSTTADCEDNYDQGMDIAMDIRQRYQTASNNGSGSLGPREFGLASDDTTVLTGTLKAQRKLLGAPIIRKDFRFELQITGGNSKKTMRIDVCMLDPATGNILGGDNHFSDQLVNAQLIARPSSSQQPHIVHTFRNVTGYIPLFFFQKPAGFKGFEWNLDISESGQPFGQTLTRTVALIPTKRK